MARRNKQQATLEQILAAIKEGQNQTPKQDPAALAKREKSLQREIEMLEHKEKLIVKGNSSAEKSLALAKAQLAINRKREQKELASIQRRKELGELEGDELKRAYERLDAMEDDHDADEKKIIDDEKKIETKKELIDTIEKEIAAIAGVSKSMSGQIAIYGKHRMVSTDALMGLMKSIKQNGILQSVMGAGIGIMTGFIDTTIALAFSVDEARASLMKTTGVTRDFATAMTSDVQEMSKFLVSAEDMNATLGALIPTFTDFTNLNKAQQREIRQTGDLLAKGGVSLEDYGQNLQMLTKGMALGPETAAAFSREMSSLATAIGVTPQQMAKDFAGVSGSLMKLGSEGPKAFKALALASKATGLEVSKLLQITDKFDTFEGAAEQAGRLNAALGGNFVNAMDLMMDTDPVGRLNQIRDAILNTGLTFDDMGYMQRKFYAEAAGMENTADLALLLSGDLDALKESSRESSDSILALQQRTKAMQSIQEKFKALLMSLIPVFEPLITQLHDLVNTLDRDDVVEKISAAFVSLGEAFRWVQKWGEPVLWTLGTLFVGKYALGFILFLKNMGVLGALAPKVGAGLGLANISFLEFAAAVVLVGAGIALAAYGLSFLVKSFGEIGDNAGYAVGGILAFGVTMAGIIATFAYMAPVVAASTAALIPFGFAVLQIGAGIGLAAAGIGYMAASFADLMKVASADQLMALGGALTLIALSAAGLGYIAPIAGVGMGILVLGFAGLAMALGMMSEELVSLEKFTTSLGALASDTTNLKQVSAEIVAIANAISSLPAGRAIELSTAMKSSQISATSAAMMQSVRASAEATRPAAAATPKFDVTVKVDGVVTKAVTQVSKKVEGQYLDTGGG